ncbi:MAG: HNH endonuclease [Clostridiales bacterium]|nr:HNH endonuclease [Clostridiales bacterium]
MIAFITITAIIISVVIVLLCLYFRQRKYDNFILKNSLCLKQLREINNRYEFNSNISFDQYHTYDNEKFYDTISCEDYLIYQLQYISKKVVVQIKKISENKQSYSNYLSEVKTISDFGKFQSPIKYLNLEKLITKEKQFLRKNLLQKPITQFTLTITLYCSTINGCIYDKKTAIFDDSDIFALVKRLNNKNGTFYNDREIWNSLCRVERGKVSNKMRFSIYERDGYRCCKCGISERYADLEIDHIIPISKGGKSTYDNLQTLCHRCNVEKGNSINKKY